ncbi:phospholipase B1, membrane-associated-like [Diadema antillarum]|uniref:phospholipase B1, membrane-associated-like n=1 Tax=Diadema antillarum TaxID=105358 RepID=UPI003A8771E7
MSAFRPQPTVGADFNCPASVSPTVPKSVHLLRPGDINVIGALGDSLTASYAAGASRFFPVMFEYPGLSASAGGDRTLKSVLTLPNVFRKYNPGLYGFSTGKAIVFTSPANKKLNVAISGSYAEDMLDQAKTLVKKMKNDPAIDFDNDWKFVTLFIGGNDLCESCLDVWMSPEDYIAYIEEALTYLHDESPRTFVNVLGIMQVQLIAQNFGPLSCDAEIPFLCPCVVGGKIPRERLRMMAREYQSVLRKSVESGKFDDKDDFAVVYQPFFEDSKLPQLPDGSPDRTYFSPDCFHFSQTGQAAQATANWNTLFQPVGSKSTAYIPGEELDCPSTEFPYLYTNVNSREGFLASRNITASRMNRIFSP